MAADLDARLRSALRLPDEPGATDETRAAVLAALRRYRGRRRIALAGVGASVLGALVLGLVAITGTVAQKPGPTAVRSHGGSIASAAGPSCVEVRIGAGRLACAGQPAVVEAPRNTSLAGPAQPRYESAAPSSTAAVLHAASGRPVEVSLPISNTSWKRVLVVSEDHVIRNVTRIGRVSGRAVATIRGLPPGTYVITALGAARCARGAFCPALAEQRSWTVTLTVG